MKHSNESIWRTCRQCEGLLVAGAVEVSPFVSNLWTHPCSYSHERGGACDRTYSVICGLTQELQVGLHRSPVSSSSVSQKQQVTIQRYAGSVAGYVLICFWQSAIASRLTHNPTCIKNAFFAGAASGDVRGYKLVPSGRWLSPVKFSGHVCSIHTFIRRYFLHGFDILTWVYGI